MRAGDPARLLAENAEDALRLFTRQTRRPDLLLTDIMMSGMDGHTLAAQLRAIDPTLKILFTSGYPTGTSSGRDLLPETAFVQKPFTPDGLTSAIRAALDRPGC